MRKFESWRFSTSINAILRYQRTMSTNQPPTIVYTDGSYRNKKCGIGVYFPGDKSFTSRELSKAIEHHRLTNQVAELIACITAIKIAQKTGVKHLEICTDSQYVVKSMNQWIQKWINNNWKKVGTKCDIENKDLMMELNILCTSVEVKWVHIPRNENKKANDLAQKATKHL